eukprot:8257394-Karenia_brevis.AAC.1
MSHECVDLVRQLVNYKVQSQPAALQGSMRLWYSRRWWGILSVAIQRAVTFNLAPSLGPQELEFPSPTLEHLVASTIVPPDVSRVA